MLHAAYNNAQNLIFSPNPVLRRVIMGAILAIGALASALYVGVLGPTIALATALALIGGVMILLDTHWGFVALVGVTHEDTQAEAELLAAKTANLRVFEDADGKMNLSLLDISAGVLVVSQFTLYADSRKGRRPSFIHAARPEIAEPLVQYYADRLRQEGIQHVEMGRFGAMMQVTIHNDGPVTILLDSDELSKK